MRIYEIWTKHRRQVNHYLVAGTWKQLIYYLKEGGKEGNTFFSLLILSLPLRQHNVELGRWMKKIKWLLSLQPKLVGTWHAHMLHNPKLLSFVFFHCFHLLAHIVCHVSCHFKQMKWHGVHTFVFGMPVSRMQGHEFVGFSFMWMVTYFPLCTSSISMPTCGTDIRKAL